MSESGLFVWSMGFKDQSRVILTGTPMFYYRVSSGEKCLVLSCFAETYSQMHEIDNLCGSVPLHLIAFNLPSTTTFVFLCGLIQIKSIQPPQSNGSCSSIQTGKSTYDYVLGVIDYNWGLKMYTFAEDYPPMYRLYTNQSALNVISRDFSRQEPTP